MFEKVNPHHPDKVADRIAGALVDYAYSKEDNPKIAVEVLIGHGKCHIIAETSVNIPYSFVCDTVERISGVTDTEYKEVPQDQYLSNNQRGVIRCGDNGIFKGTPITTEQKFLTTIAKAITAKYPYDGKYLINDGKITICQSNANSLDIKRYLQDAIVNPLGNWTGGTDVDSGATNRKLGSDMGDSVTGGGLCLSGDSEYLADDLKWHHIDEYQGGKVAQWNNGKLEFVVPNEYISNPEEKLLYIYNDYKLSMCLTPKHEMLIKTSKGNFIKKEAKDIYHKLKNHCGNSGSIIHNFIFDNDVNSKYITDEDLFLQIAFCADGTILSESNKKWRGRIRVKKQYKKDRLRLLLKNKPCLETQDKEFSIFWFNPVFENKSLYECCKNEDFEKVYNEIFKWDGDEKRKLFRTTKKGDADFIQLVIQSQNKTAGICYCEKKNYYIVKEYKSNTTGLRLNKGVFINAEEKYGKSYCFNVPSHNLIIRHNNKIFITGNCGKDLSKSDVTLNIMCYLLAKKGTTIWCSCSIGDTIITFHDEEGTFDIEYATCVNKAKEFIENRGGFEKFAEWGLIN